MKLKRKIGISLAVAAATYCVLAYIFMWPPVVTKYRPQWSANPCINNLRQLDAAIHQFALEHDKHGNDPVTFNDLTPYIKLNSEGKLPPCPNGGTYIVTTVSAPPVCSTTMSKELKPRKVRHGIFFYDWIGGPPPVPAHVLP